MAVFSRDETTGALTFVEMQEDGVAGVDSMVQAYAVTVSPNGSRVFVTAESSDAVVVFRRNATTGALTYVETKKDGVDSVDGLDAPRSVTVSPDGKHLYATGMIDDAVVGFEVAPLSTYLPVVIKNN